MPKMNKARRLSAGVFILLLVSMGAAADDAKDISELHATIVNLVDELVNQGVLTRAQADAMIRKAQADATKAVNEPATAEPAEDEKQPGVVRVPYVPEIVKQEIREQVINELKKEVVQDVAVQAEREHWIFPGMIPEWTQRIKWEGDLRLRLEQIGYASSNAPYTYPNFQNINNKRGFSNPAQEEDYLNSTVDRSRLRLGCAWA